MRQEAKIEEKLPTAEPATLEIEEDIIPFAAGLGFSNYSLISLVLTVYMLVLMVLYFFKATNGNQVLANYRKDRSYENFRKYRDAYSEDRTIVIMKRALVVALSLAAAVVLFILNDFAAPMVMLNLSTLIIASMAIVQSFVIFANRREIKIDERLAN